MSSITNLINEFENSFTHINTQQIESSLKLVLNKERNETNAAPYFADEDKVGGALSFSDITSNFGNKTNYTAGDNILLDIIGG